MTKVHIPVNVRGTLDTSNPVSSLPPGTLTTAEDLDSRAWGPRTGGRSLTHPHDYPTGARLPGPGNLIIFDGNVDYALGLFASPEQRDLGTKWTLDLVIGPEQIDHSSTADFVAFRWNLKAGLDAVTVYIRGTNSGGDDGKIKVTITPTSAPDTAGTARTITSTNAVSIGTDQSDRHAIRVQRDGETATLWVNGVQEGQVTNLSATQGHEGLSEVGAWYLADNTPSGSNELFKGKLYRVLMRDGLYGNPHMGVVEHMFPWGRACRLSVVGTVSPAVVRDRSRYRAHGSTSASSETSSADEPPFLTPVQNMLGFTDYKGRTWNFVLTGGTGFWERVS